MYYTLNRQENSQGEKQWGSSLLREMNRERLRKQLKVHEGVFHRVYLDSFNIPSIGVGFNLLRDDAREKIALIGANYDRLVARADELTDAQIDALLDMCIDEAERTARERVLCDMSFNLGYTKFSHFIMLRRYVAKGNWTAASVEMRNSDWFRQVGVRGIRLAAMMLDGGELPF